MTKAIKTEHGGAKNGGGYWGRRVVAKAVSRKLRRENDKHEVAVNLLAAVLVARANRRLGA